MENEPLIVEIKASQGNSMVGMDLVSFALISVILNYVVDNPDVIELSVQDIIKREHFKTVVNAVSLFCDSCISIEECLSDDNN